MTADLYQDPIIKLSKESTHTGPLDTSNAAATVSNPLCGDRVTVELNLIKGKIQKIAVQVRGCILSKAAANHLAITVCGMGIGQVKQLRDELEFSLQHHSENQNSFPKALAVFSPVAAHKSRHSCLLLAYDAVIEAMTEK